MQAWVQQSVKSVPSRRVQCIRRCLPMQIKAFKNLNVSFLASISITWDARHSGPERIKLLSFLRSCWNGHIPLSPPPHLIWGSRGGAPRWRVGVRTCVLWVGGLVKVVGVGWYWGCSQSVSSLPPSPVKTSARSLHLPLPVLQAQTEFHISREVTAAQPRLLMLQDSEQIWRQNVW